jgi:hypothetical protein
MRYAFADWGRLPGNPTLYEELSRFSDGPPTLESKLLLSGNVGERLHWGANLVFERDLAGHALFNQYGFTGGLMYVLADRVFALGGEVLVESTDMGAGDRGELAELWLQAGPCLQWHPVPPLHINLVWLFGAYGERGSTKLEYDARTRPLLVLGWEL